MPGYTPSSERFDETVLMNTLPVKPDIQVRTIEAGDNTALQALITSVVLEMGAMDSEYLSGSDELADLYQLYTQPRSRYYVLVDAETKTILGGGGIAPLLGVDDDGLGEIQKMYFSSSLRGKGMGTQVLNQLLQDAKAFGFTSLYLETKPEMLGAIKLYERSGFQHIPVRMGSTGHECCTVFMQRVL
jgi:putative acetyltransferase